MGNLSPMDVMALPRVSETDEEAEVVVLLGNKLVRVPLSSLFAGVGVSGDNASVTTVNGIVTVVKP